MPSLPSQVRRDLDLTNIADVAELEQCLLPAGVDWHGGDTGRALETPTIERAFTDTDTIQRIADLDDAIQRLDPLPDSTSGTLSFLGNFGGAPEIFVRPSRREDGNRPTFRPSEAEVASSNQLERNTATEEEETGGKRRGRRGRRGLRRGKATSRKGVRQRKAALRRKAK